MEYSKYGLNLIASKFRDYIIKANSISEVKESFYDLSYKGQINDMYIRPTLWKIMLTTLPSDDSTTIETWINTVHQQRQKYKNKLIELSNIKKFKHNPLDNKPDELWLTFYSENDTWKLIHLDIDRTFQDKVLFTLKSTKDIISRILFVWTKDHPYPSYRQGMNEIVGILFLTLFQYYLPIDSQYKKDILTLLQMARTDPVKYYKELYLFLHDENEIEADIFMLYENIMDFGLCQFFEVPIKERGDDESKLTYLLNRCERIVHEDLNAYDNRLYKHFNEIDLDCTMFLQRWLKCLFDREFTFEEVVILWDYILSKQKKENKKGFLIADYISLAMIENVKSQVITKEQNDAFRILFRYPKVDSMNTIIKLTEKIIKELPFKLIENARPQNEVKGKSLMEQEMLQKENSKSKYYTYVVGNTNKNINNVDNNNKNGNVQLKSLVRNLEEYITKYRLDMQLRDIGRMDELFEKIYTLLKK